MLYIVLCNLSTFNRISCITTSKDTWDSLEVTFEGIDRVRETEMNILLEKYEPLKMESGKTITQIT